MFKWFSTNIVRRFRLSVNDILQHLDTDDSYDQEMAEGSDDDLEMDTDYDYNSDSSAEGNKIFVNNINACACSTIYTQKLNCTDLDHHSSPGADPASSSPCKQLHNLYGK